MVGTYNLTSNVGTYGMKKNEVEEDNIENATEEKESDAKVENVSEKLNQLSSNSTTKQETLVVKEECPEPDITDKEVQEIVEQIVGQAQNSSVDISNLEENDVEAQGSEAHNQSPGERKKKVKKKRMERSWLTRVVFLKVG